MINRLLLLVLRLNIQHRKVCENEGGFSASFFWFSGSLSAHTQMWSFAMKSAMLFSFVSTRPAILIFITREWRMRYRPFPPRRNGSKTSFLESSLFFFLLRRLSSLLHSSLEAVFPLASLLGKTCNWRMQVGDGDMCLWGGCCLIQERELSGEMCLCFPRKWNEEKSKDT